VFWGEKSLSATIGPGPGIVNEGWTNGRFSCQGEGRSFCPEPEKKPMAGDDPCDVPDPFQDAVDASTEAEGLDLSQLEANDVVDVETQHHLYTFILSDPAKGEAEAMSNGEKIVEPMDAMIVGSLIGDTTICMKRILIGYSLEVAIVEGKTYHLSPTKRIAVNGVTILPRTASSAN
jgi:hypothetical protein